MKVLITGFETFNGHQENSSEIMARALSREEIISLILPVEYEKSFEILKKKIEDENPQAVICLGLAQDREAITLEQIAINFNHASIADNAGVLKLHQKIDPRGENAYFSTLPLEQILTHNYDYPVRLSLSAGSYVCNDLFYRLMNDRCSQGKKAGFIHLPHLKDNHDQILKTLKQIIQWL